MMQHKKLKTEKKALSFFHHDFFCKAKKKLISELLIFFSISLKTTKTLSSHV